ncbi:MAG: triose-phosphate isomerase [Pseudomonadota bacterium]
MRQPLIAGNWKMHGSRTDNAALIGGIRGKVDDAPGVELLVCPPSVFLAQVGSEIGSAGIALGAQNVSEYATGAYTGEVSATMLAEMGCHYVLVGHSERRSLFAELNEQVAAKFAAAVEQGLRPVLCVGETLGQRQEGETDAVVLRQLDAVIDLVGPNGLRNAVIAYEPVWAIGTGETATPKQAQEVHAVLRQRLVEVDAELGAAMRILYGGSMKPANAAGLLSQPDIDGGLIGGASLDADQFMAIAAAASEQLKG